MEIALFLLAGILLVYLASRSQGNDIPRAPIRPAVTNTDPGSDTTPIIDYVILVADPRTGQWLHMEAPADYPHHYGILAGQYIQLQWQILHADFIHMEGIGYVQAIGSKDLFPNQATRYRIQARNRNHQAEQQIVVHVFPVPVMEHILTPLPDLNARIELKLDPLTFPGLPQPIRLPHIDRANLLPLQQKLRSDPPKPIPMNPEIYKLSLNDYIFKNLTINILNKITGQASGPGKS